MYIGLLLGYFCVEKFDHTEQQVDGAHIAICNNSVGSLVGGDEQVGGKDRPHHIHHGVGVRKFERYDLCNDALDLLFMEVTSVEDAAAHLERLLGRIDVYNVVLARNSVEPACHEYCKHHIVHLVLGNVLGRDETDLSLHPVADDKAPSRYLAHGFQKDVDVDLVEIHGHLGLFCKGGIYEDDAQLQEDEWDKAEFYSKAAHAHIPRVLVYFIYRLISPKTRAEAPKIPAFDPSFASTISTPSRESGRDHEGMWVLIALR